ncbi:ribokinase [Rhizobium sp. Root149]|uniref:ribokinase n=1 Tax=Rhizobium sp. Root149 TaxID=1736473 RepID=UPI0007140E0C|nr:ribokinase [Rhizobium sp. Root149]KQZ50633.1 ribokinase [Rhizobium sp. Root149]
MITVFGSINMDLIATTTRLPKPGETVAGQSFTTAAGGKGANQALAARRAGSTVRMAGAVGEDGFAEPALALLKEAGVLLDTVRPVSDPTGTAIILVGGDGENMIAVVPGANGAVSAEDAEKSVGLLSERDILMMQMEVPAGAIETAFRLAKTQGTTTIFNTAPLTDDAIRLAGLADIVVSNETEFELLIGRSGLSADERVSEMQQMAERTGQTLVVTLGADGVVAIHKGQILRATGLKITPVDTVGAGDTFCGYLAASLDQGFDFAAALRRAAIAGSLACLEAGAQPSIPASDGVAGHL